MNYILVIDCKTKQMADKVYKGLFKPNCAYKTDVELDNRNLSYAIYAEDVDLKALNLTECHVIYKIKDLTTITSKPVKAKQEVADNKLDKKSNVIHHKGMSLHDFLQNNPTIRTVDEVKKYYSMEVINKGHYAGVFEILHGKIRF